MLDTTPVLCFGEWSERDGRHRRQSDHGVTIRFFAREKLNRCRLVAESAQPTGELGVANSLRRKMRVLMLPAAPPHLPKCTFTK
jgi:hypothetical protein